MRHVPPPRPPQPLRFRQRRWPAILAAVVVVAVAIAALWVGFIIGHG